MITLLDEKLVTCIRLSAYAFGPSTSTQKQGHMLSIENDLADGLALRSDGSWSRLSVVVAWTVHACAESVRVPDFLRDLLAKPARLTREPTCNGSRPPLYIDEGLRSIEAPTIDPIKSTYCFYLMHYE
jgi:hypothetical protein